MRLQGTLFNSHISSNSYFSNKKNDLYGANLVNDHANNPTEHLDKMRDTRAMLREITQTRLQNDNKHQAYSSDRVNGYLDLKKTDENNKKLQEKTNYNYKEVSTKIQRAKTSVSAGQAVISAKRKVQEIRRKIAGKKGDAKELQLALTHAKRMEMVARKKKHHLEIEELIEHTQKLDERMDEQEDVTTTARNMVIDQAEEKITAAEDEIFDEREELFDETVEEYEEAEIQMTDDMMAELNEMISEFGEDELEQLEETMEMLEDMEIVDPHMSEEDFEQLKLKHRSSERKAMMKADMDYLKSLIKYTMENQSTSINSVAPITNIQPVMSESAAPSIDIMA